MKKLLSLTAVILIALSALTFAGCSSQYVKNFEYDITSYSTETSFDLTTSKTMYKVTYTIVLIDEDDKTIQSKDFSYSFKYNASKKVIKVTDYFTMGTGSDVDEAYIKNIKVYYQPNATYGWVFGIVSAGILVVGVFLFYLDLKNKPFALPKFKKASAETDEGKAD